MPEGGKFGAMKAITSSPQWRGLSATAKALWYALWFEWGGKIKDGFVTAYPRLEDMILCCKASDRTVYRALADLESAGLMVSEKGHRVVYRKMPATCHQCHVTPVSPDKFVTVTCHPCQSLHISETDQEQTKEKSAPPTPPIRKRKAPKDEMPAIPEALRTPDFCAAWEEFAAHRREIRHPLTPTSAGRALKDLEPFGAGPATERLHTVVSNGWRGCVFPEDKQAGHLNGRLNGHANGTHMDSGQAMDAHIDRIKKRLAAKRETGEIT